MPLANYPKTPAEVKRYSVDYNDWLDLGEQLSGVVFAAAPVTVPPLVANTPVFESDGRGLQYMVSGGVNGYTYEVLITATSSSGQIKQSEVIFAVKEL